MTHTVPLPDQRSLGFAEYGRAHGLPALFCHPTPGSRLHVSTAMSDVADDRGIRLIVPDRPGYGLSDPKPHGRFIDWPGDVAILLTHLGIDRVRVIGYSIGAAYALACASAMPARVTSVSLVGPVAANVFDPDVTAKMTSATHALFALARDHPSQLIKTLETFAPDAESLFTACAAGVSKIDRALLAQSQIASTFQSGCVETLRQRFEGMSADYALLAQPWGFALEEIRTPIDIWCGVEDITTPPAMAQYLAAHLPRHTIHLLPGEGHLCVFTHWESILGAECGVT